MKGVPFAFEYADRTSGDLSGSVALVKVGVFRIDMVVAGAGHITIYLERGDRRGI